MYILPTEGNVLPKLTAFLTSTLLHSSGVLSLPKIQLNVALSNPLLQPLQDISPTVFPFNALLTSLSLFFVTSSSTTVTSSTCGITFIFLFHQFFKVLFPSSITLLAHVNIFPPLSLITLACCTSYCYLSALPTCRHNSFPPVDYSMSEWTAVSMRLCSVASVTQREQFWHDYFANFVFLR